MIHQNQELYLVQEHMIHKNKILTRMEAFSTQDIKIVVADLSANHHETIDQYQVKKFFQDLVRISFSLILVEGLKNIESKIRLRV